MFRKYLALPLIALFMAFAGIGCETTGATGGGGAGAAAVGAPQPAQSRTETTLDTFQPGQKITIEFTDVAGAPPPFTQTILENGDILLPLDQRVKAAGKTRDKLVEEIQALYVPSHYRRLTVNIQTEDKWYFVGGEVRSPGQKLYTAGMTVVKAIQAAGDFTVFAKETNVEVTRANGQRIVVNAKKARDNAKLDVPIFPGDRIHVKKSRI